MSQYKSTSYPNPHKLGWFRNLAHTITGCRFNYQIDLVYYYKRDEDGCHIGTKFYSRTTQISLIDPKALDYSQRRVLHKALFPEFIKRIKSYDNGSRLKGGTANSVRIENIQYLGYY